MDKRIEEKSGEESNSSIEEVKQAQSSKNRLKIIIVLLLTAILLGLPSWYVTTSVEREVLPVEEITNLTAQYFNNLKYRIPVEMVDLPMTLDGLVDETQALLDEKLKSSTAQIKLNNSPAQDVTEEQYKLKLVLSDEDNAGKLIMSPNRDRSIKLFITPEIIKNRLVSDLISKVLIESLFDVDIGRLEAERDIIKFPFSTDYKISINFLHSSDKMFDWDENNRLLRQSLQNFRNFIEVLQPMANFTVEFQELWYEKRIKTDDEYKIDGVTYIRDTSRFVDYSDWGLDQDVELNPIINLNLYLPENEKIRIENSAKNSFLIPQWGGVVVLNHDEVIDHEKLNEIFDIFAFQILKLVGINTNLNKSVYYRIDEMIRVQTLENIFESLKNYQSLIELISQLETIPIPLQVVDEIKESIENLKGSVTNLNSSNWLNAYKLSTNALKLSNVAFFHKDMVSQAYFPEEHKLAVYSPLLGPLITMTILALIRVVKELRN